MNLKEELQSATYNNLNTDQILELINTENISTGQ